MSNQVNFEALGMPPIKISRISENQYGYTYRDARVGLVCISSTSPENVVLKLRDSLAPENVAEVARLRAIAAAPPPQPVLEPILVTAPTRTDGRVLRPADAYHYEGELPERRVEVAEDLAVKHQTFADFYSTCSAFEFRQRCAQDPEFKKWADTPQ